MSALKPPYYPNLTPPAPPESTHGGSGSPEGVVVGSPFQTWFRTDTNTTYTKKTGESTDTGWVAESGGGGGAGVTDGDKGEITVSDDGATWTINDGALQDDHYAALSMSFGKLQATSQGGIVSRIESGAGALTANSLIAIRDAMDGEADVASATTTDIGAATSPNVRITGTTAITGLGTKTAGAKRFVRFADALTLTHHATQLILPGGANITTAAGDSMLAKSEGSGNWRVLDYWRADGKPLVLGSSGTGVGTLTLGDGGSFSYAITPQTMSANTVFIPDTAPTTGFPYHTASGSNLTETHVAGEGTGNVVRRSLLNSVTYFEFAISDESTAITTGTAKVTWRAPFAFTVTAVRASLSTESSSGTPTVDINEGGATILSTKLTIDANEKTSTTAAAAAVISDSAIADDAEITFDIDVAGTGAKGLKVKIYYTK